MRPKFDGFTLKKVENFNADEKEKLFIDAEVQETDKKEEDKTDDMQIQRGSIIKAEDEKNILGKNYQIKEIYKLIIDGQEKELSTEEDILHLYEEIKDSLQIIKKRLDKIPYAKAQFAKEKMELSFQTMQYKIVIKILEDKLESLKK